MRYNLQLLRRKGGNDFVTFSVGDFGDYKHFENDFVPEFPFDVKATFKEVGNTVLLNLSFNVTLNLVCDKCLEQFSQEFSLSEDFTVESKETENAECIVAVNGGVELDPIVWEMMCLALPYRKICNENCKGINLECNKEE